jgi:hypothetical protein
MTGKPAFSPLDFVCMNLRITVLKRPGKGLSFHRPGQTVQETEVLILKKIILRGIQAY